MELWGEIRMKNEEESEEWMGHSERREIRGGGGMGRKEREGDGGRGGGEKSKCIRRNTIRSVKQKWDGMYRRISNGMEERRRNEGGFDRVGREDGRNAVHPKRVSGESTESREEVMGVIGSGKRRRRRGGGGRRRRKEMMEYDSNEPFIIIFDSFKRRHFCHNPDTWS